MRFDVATLARFRAGILQRGLVLSTVLAELLAGKDKAGTLAALALRGKPGMTPEELVRAALDAVEARRRLIDADDDAFGRCDVCHVDLGVAALGELPWADRCQAHADA